jgi:hypothetical protein
MSPQVNNWFRSTLAFLDEHILLILTGFLLAFIPLWPKIPLWSPIEQYIVRVRLEDFVILLTGIVWLIQVIRRKVIWRSAMFWMVFAYGVVGALSVLSAVFVTKTIPLQPLHLGKSLLHFFRYLEYFALFFFGFSSIKKREHLYVLIGIFAATVLSISIYGYGQKYYFWPVYSTMNREFSKGVRLVLTPHARVQSTFAGHYDMAAFLVIALPLLLAFAYQVKDKVKSTLLHLSFWIGTWLIIVSASRTSFLAFLLAVVLVVGLTSLHKTGVWKKFTFAVSRSFVILLISGILFAYFGADLTERLSQVLDSNQQLHDTFHAWNKQRKEFMAKISGESVAPTPPPGSITTDDAIAMGILTPTDERPVPAVPKDVYVNVPDIQKVATTSADGKTTIIEIDKGPRTYSENAQKYGLSLAIRLDELWPNAINGFKTNPLLGKGYATLNKKGNEQFTEAESTDNNFLRTLGETGLLGFITFYGVVVLILINAVKGMKSRDFAEQALAIGMFSATIGLLLNAVYIDVFAASKVAQTYWAISGIFLGYLYLQGTYKAAFTAQESTVLKESNESGKDVEKKKTVKKKGK